jgi:hypothetical protein
VPTQALRAHPTAPLNNLTVPKKKLTTKIWIESHGKQKRKKEKKKEFGVACLLNCWAGYSPENSPPQPFSISCSRTLPLLLTVTFLNGMSWRIRVRQVGK